MAGTRRGRDRQEESDAFEAANPFLTRVETTLEVVPVEMEEEQCWWEPPTHDVLVTQDGQEVPSDANPMGTPFGFSTSYGVYTPIGDLMAGGDFDEWGKGSDWGHGSDSGEPELSLSDYGFGVWSDDEEVFPEGPLSLHIEEEDGPEINMAAIGLNDDETLEFDLFGDRYFDGPYYEMGGVSFEIDFVVLGGSGQVGVALSDYYDGPSKIVSFGEGDDGMIEVLSDFLSEGDTGSLTANAMGEDLFQMAEVFVDGSLVVGITGISVVTNFAGDMFDLT